MTTNKPYPVKKHEFVIAKVNNIQNQQFKFSANETLKNKKVVGLTFHPSQYLTKSPANDTLVSNALATNQGFLVLKTLKGVEVINRIPLYMLAAGVSSGGTYEKIFPVDHLEIDWESSYVQMASANILTVDTAFMVSVFYEDGTQACK